MTVLETDITDLLHDGRGVAHIDGKAIFVVGALAGERVKIKFTGKHRRYDEAVVEEILVASPDRVTPRCPHFGVCGGCALQHLSPEAQIAGKQRVLMENLERIGKVEPQHTLPPLTDQPWGYRRKARLSVKFVEKKGRVLVGFREIEGRFVADIHRCEVLHPAVGERIEALTALVESLDAKREIPQIEVAAGDDLVALVIRHMRPLSEHDLAALTAFAQTSGLGIFLQSGGMDSVKPLWPEQIQLTYRLPSDLDIEFRPLDFVQVNAGMNRRMIELTLDLLSPTPDDRILDLFCGLGNFTLPLAKQQYPQCELFRCQSGCRSTRSAVGEGGARSRTFGSATQRRRRRSGVFAETIDPTCRLRLLSSRFACARRGNARASTWICPEKHRRDGYVSAYGPCGIDCGVRSQMIVT
jgi:23S rRNA (uracil1939-C5)-methyltransferase